MKAVILAAGIGSRLGKLTKEKPKCMLEIGKNQTIIEYQINELMKNGLKENDIFIIAGYKIDTLKNYLKKKDINVNIIFNSKYNIWNNVYSFYLINNISNIKNEETFILLNSDTYFHEKILEKLILDKRTNLLMVDTCKKLGSEEMKVIAKNKKVIKLGKDIPVEHATGEYIGIAKFKKKDISPIFRVIENLLKEGKTDIWYEIAFNKITNKIDIFFTDTSGLPWIEIDTQKDLEKAKNLDI